MRRVTATYRLQLNVGFTFADAQARVAYLAALGVSHLYLSPIFAARSGSQHGYDVVDPTMISPELGGEAGFRDLAAAARQAGLGIVLDIVPNHMATDSANPAWMAVLEHGRAAPSARLFDIDWSQDRILLPVLGGALDEVLARGEIAIETEAGTGRRVARYFDQAFPLRPDGPDAGTGLADLLAAQHWRLADWHLAARELTHRRFFNITDLIGLRVEDPAVFEHVHRLPLALLKEGLVDGLRVDHVDGLADPEAYCRMLREAAGPEALLVVEKILEGDETLRDWPVDGTTGYERLNDINGLFIEEAGYQWLDAHLIERGLLAGDAHARLIAAKRQVLDEMFGSEVARLARLAAATLADEDFSADEIAATVTALAVHSPVYRSYASERGHAPNDEAIWDKMAADIAAGEPARIAAAAGALLDAIRVGDALALATGLQQLAGPAMAKGLEDTEFYRSAALLSANEVGADLSRPAMDIERFHARNAAALARRDLVPLATHDTKRGADVRARLNLLAADPAATIELMGRLSGLAAGLPRAPAAPDGLDEWLILETLLGAWPISADRLAGYLTKAMREAKRHTRWEAPEPGYEAAVLGFARALVDSDAGQPVRDAITAALRGLNPPAVWPVSADDPAARGPGHRRHLSGHGVLGPQPRRSRQSPPRRLDRARRGARRRRLDRFRRRRHRARQVPHAATPAGAAPRQSGPRRGGALRAGRGNRRAGALRRLPATLADRLPARRRADAADTARSARDSHRPTAGALAERHERSRVRDRLRRPGARPELAFRPRA